MKQITKFLLIILVIPLLLIILFKPIFPIYSEKSDVTIKLLNKCKCSYIVIPRSLNISYFEFKQANSDAIINKGEINSDEIILKNVLIGKLIVKITDENGKVYYIYKDSPSSKENYKKSITENFSFIYYYIKDFMLNIGFSLILFFATYAYVNKKYRNRKKAIAFAGMILVLELLLPLILVLLV